MSLFENTVRTISYLCQCEDEDKIEKIKPALKLLKELLMSDDTDVVGKLKFYIFI